MSAISRFKQGVRLYDRRTGYERLIYDAETYGQIVFLSFKNPQTGAIERQPYPITEVESRFDILDQGSLAFKAEPEAVSLVAEAHRLRHAYLFNPLFATETSLIDLLPHQLAAVYGVPPTVDYPGGQPGMLEMPRLRFLLADDAGAGKTIMAGLLIREMLLRRMVRRVLIVPPAGLVGNWERELRVLFRLQFRLLSSGDASEGYNPFIDPRNDLAIVSMDTLWHTRMREAYTASLNTAPPYDLVIFDEAHKLSARINPDLTLDPTNRYQMAELIARQGRHLLLLTATPHMGRDGPYYLLWRLLEPELFSTQEAFQRLGKAQKRRYLLRRMKEEMTRFNGDRIFPPRDSKTVEYPLIQGAAQEQDLYDQVTQFCETHFDRAKLRNRSAAGLAMSILQRRLASSTWAMYLSLTRREEKLGQTLQELESGLISPDGLDARQEKLPDQDVRDTKTGDEEEGEAGKEESEQQDDEIAAATDSRTVQELRVELDEVHRLVNLARKVYDRKHESKFERLWEALQEYPDTKILIFTEFRDTLNFLVDRLEGKGLTGKIARIDGSMDFQERTRQVETFRDLNGARILIATDAAGEGINLQFCWLLVNYDIPWNPARLEQRMGRVHRYKQNHDVLLLNLISKDTREGRVLKVLLDKLESIRKELGSDKVFDIIGQQFSGKPLTELIFEAVIEGKEEQAKDEIERTLTTEQVKAGLAAQSRKVEVSEVRAVLSALQSQRDIAELKRMMPAYIRRFFQLVAPRLEIGIKGDIEGIFSLDPCPAPLQHALNTYPAEIQSCLTFERELAMPDLGREPQAVYLHPGEPVFEAVMDLFLGQTDHLSIRGGTFLDGEAAEPYIFYLVRASVLREPPSPPTMLASPSLPQGEREVEMVDEQLTGLRRYADGRIELAPAHLLLTLFQPSGPDQRDVQDFTALAGDTAPVEAFMLENVAIPALEKHRKEEEIRLPAQVEQLRVAYNLRQAELFRQRRLLKDAVENGIPAASTKLRECEAELNTLDRQRREAEAALYAAPEQLRLGPVNFYAQALVLPVPAEDVERRRNDQAEKIALQEVRQREEAEGSIIEDVSNPQLKAGFDFKVLRADGSLRYIEVKGRSGQPAVTLEQNEWAQSANHLDRYWLYVVYHCDTVPALYRVPNPFGRLLAKQTGAVRINASEIINAAE